MFAMPRVLYRLNWVQFRRTSADCVRSRTTRARNKLTIRIDTAILIQRLDAQVDRYIKFDMYSYFILLIWADFVIRSQQLNAYSPSTAVLQTFCFEHIQFFSDQNMGSFAGFPVTDVIDWFPGYLSP